MKPITNYLSITFLFILSFFSNSIIAQTTCVAKAPGQVGVGQPFQYSVTLNAEATQIVSTDFSNFSVLNGPHSSSSTSITMMNGRTTQNNSFTYSYTLSAKKTGTFTIPASSFKVNGKTIKSNPVSIQVVQGSQQTQSNSRYQRDQQNNTSFNEKDIFVKGYASKTNPYIGEEVIITHKLYIGPSINGGYRIDNINIPSQNGLWSYTLGDPKANTPQTTEVIDGKRYTVYDIRKTAVFPQKAGTITVTPMEVTFTARVISRQSTGDPFFDQFFGGGQSARDYTIDIKSNSIKLNVLDFPKANRPDNFSGLSGNFSIKALISRDKLKTNEATNLTITVSGSGNLQHVEDLNLVFPSGLDVTDPKITDQINTSGNSVSGTRIFEYVIIPRNTGTFTLPTPTFSYFDLQTKTFKTISAVNFKLSVEKGSGDQYVSSSTNQKKIKMLGKDIRFIKTTKHNFKKSSSEPFFGSPLYYSLLIFPMILFIILLIIRRKQIEYYSNTALVKNKKARKVAQKNLKNGYKLLQLNQKDPFYIEISRALWGYLSNKYHIPLAQLSMESVEAKLKEKGISDDMIRQFIETLDQCEYARFAPGDSSLLMKEMYNKALQFILNNESVNKNEL